MSTKNKKANKQGIKLTRYMKASVKLLAKAREFYIRSVTECSDKVIFNTFMGCPTGPVNVLPKSYSVNSSRSSYDDDYRELVRFASIKSLGNRIDLDFLKKQQVMKQSPTNGKINMPRSYSAGIGRIDEEKPCDFEDDLKVRPANVYPRSKSYAVSRKAGLVSAA